MGAHELSGLRRGWMSGYAPVVKSAGKPNQKEKSLLSRAAPCIVGSAGNQALSLLYKDSLSHRLSKNTLQENLHDEWWVWEYRLDYL
jgi:hypothetical protein